MTKEDAEQAIGKTENGPGNEAGSQQISRRAEETEYGRNGKQTQKRGAGKIALESKSFEERNAIGDKNPDT
jgi:hypothetical protein